MDDKLTGYDLPQLAVLTPNIRPTLMACRTPVISIFLMVFLLRLSEDSFASSSSKFQDKDRGQVAHSL